MTTKILTDFFFLKQGAENRFGHFHGEKCPTKMGRSVRNLVLFEQNFITTIRKKLDCVVLIDSVSQFVTNRSDSSVFLFNKLSY